MTPPRANGNVADAIIACMDDGVGQFLKAIKDKGIEDSTLVIWFSDNGSPSEGRNGGLRAKKSTVYGGRQSARRKGDWKLVKADGKAAELYDLGADIAGRRPISRPPSRRL